MLSSSCLREREGGREGGKEGEEEGEGGGRERGREGEFSKNHCILTNTHTQ